MVGDESNKTYDDNKRMLLLYEMEKAVMHIHTVSDSYRLESKPYLTRLLRWRHSQQQQQ